MYTSICQLVRPGDLKSAIGEEDVIGLIFLVVFLISEITEEIADDTRDITDSSEPVIKKITWYK